MAKDLLTEETKALSGPIQRIIPPASANPTVIHLLPKTPYLATLSTNHQALPAIAQAKAQSSLKN